MFDIGFGEMLLLAAIALIALGPKQLPEVARTLGRFMNQMKRATGEFQRTLADVSETTTKHLDDAKNRLESHVIPANYLDESQPSLPINTAPSPVVSASAADADVGDEHKQMSFDLDKKET